MPKLKLKYRRQQLRNMKKLLKIYKEKKGSSCCPLCNFPGEGCADCIWMIETGEMCRTETAMARYNPSSYLPETKKRIKELTAWIAKYE